MRKSMKSALRFLVLVAAVPLLPALLGSRSPAGTPYLSALSDLTASSTFAATLRCSFKRCNNLHCAGGSRTDCTTDGVTCSTTICRF